MTYTVLFTPSAKRSYQDIADIKLKRGVNRILDKIKQGPYQFKKLSGPFADLRSAKTFSFRVLYEIANRQLIVTVIAIDHRKDVYR